MDARLEAILDSIGGFGRHQVWIFLVIFFSCNGLNVIIYNLNYLEKIPQEFFCVYENSPTTTVSCIPADFCDNPAVISYEPNMELGDSYNNWIGKLNIYCASGSEIGLIGSSVYIGWFISLTFVPCLADLHGRKWLMVFGVSAQFLTYCAIMIT